ncbi:GTA-gp10 family protein [Mesorhizobium xinjiangense]|uniref:GTA-gp10 family protein n=1 Tax=Mesorhizobium xinjiangense TaxID=2678685 RepID=UPI0012EDE5A3|nr:GTA-gp10 family protein [Mesorhizobium xinjiangense]
MANPHRGQVSLEAGDKAYTLSFSVNAICELEDALDRPVARIAEELNDPENIRMSTVRSVIWAALQDCHPGTTIQEAGEIATVAGTTAIMEALGRAFQLAFPDAAEGKGKPRPRKAKAG